MSNSKLPLDQAIAEILRTKPIYVLGDAELFKQALKDVGHDNNADEEQKPKPVQIVLDNLNHRQVQIALDNLDDKILQPFTDILIACTILEKNSLSDAGEKFKKNLQNKLPFLDSADYNSLKNQFVGGISLYLNEPRSIAGPGPTNGEGKLSRRRTIAALAIAAVFAIALFIVLAFSTTLSFDGNGAHHGATAAIYAIKDSEVIIPTSGFQRNGYTFVGWAQSPNGDVDLVPGETVRISKSFRLYALWCPVVSFESNGADSGRITPVPINDDHPIELPKNTFVREGYKFGGWSTTTTGEEALEPGDAINPSGPTTYFAIWLPVVSFDGNGSDSEHGNEDATASARGELTLPKCDFERKGYLFVGWSRTDDGKDALAPGEKTSANGPTTFYATWKAAVSFDGNGATGGTMDSVAQNERGEVKLPKCSFVREACDFIGWLKASSDLKQGSYYEDEDLMQPNDVLAIDGKPAKLYACWRYNSDIIEKLDVNKVVRDGVEGKTLILLITNNTDYVMDIEGEMRYVSASGKVLDKERIFSPSVAQKDVIAPTFADYGKGKGTFEYTLEARPSRYGGKSIRSRITTKEISVKKGKITLKVTNKSEETLHLFDIKAYATQANSPSDGGFAYCGGDGYDSTLKPRASTTVSFGSDDWGAPWPDLKRRYYSDGYAE